MNEQDDYYQLIGLINIINKILYEFYVNTQISFERIFIK
jgi:hypothetical protein